MRAAIGSARWALVILALVVVAAAGCGSKSGGGPTTMPGNGLELDSGDFGPGAAYQHRFNTAGTFAYNCIHHSPMTGSVSVNASATDTLATVSITSDTSPFPAATVKPGGRVVWTNNTGMVHTVTSN